MDSKQKTQQSNLAVSLGLFSNILLALLKTSIGIMGNSPALLADGINSTSDVAYYLVVGIFVRAARKPADDEHPYGHTQLESIGALVVSAFVITTAVTIFWNSISTLFNLFRDESTFQGGSIWTLWVAIFTIALKFFLFFRTKGIGKKTNNASIIALASDHKNDILASVATAVGIFIGRKGFLWVDPFAGAVVSFFILQTGISIMKDATYDLMDTIPGKALAEQVHTLLAPIEGIEEIEQLQAHRFGHYLVMNITICVNGDLSVYQGDCIANLVEKTLNDNIDYLRAVHVHFHPPKSYCPQT